MSARYQLTPSAQADVEQICAFVAEDSLERALRVHEALENAFAQLALMPQMGHKREDLTDRPVRFWSVFSYLVVYDPVSSPFAVIAILHGARDVEQLLKRI